MKLTEMDKRALATLYCLYGNEPFMWVNRGKFQWYFGVTNRSVNRLVKVGAIKRREEQYAAHWLAFRYICQIDKCITFDDAQIRQAIDNVHSDLESKFGISYARRYKPYVINNPQYLFSDKYEVFPAFQALVDSLPKESKYLVGNDYDKIKYYADSWPREAINAAVASLSVEPAKAKKSERAAE